MRNDLKEFSYIKNLASKYKSNMSLRSGVSGKPTGTGYPRGAAPGPNAGTTGGRGGNNKGTAVITLDELERIRAQVHKTNNDEYTTMRNAQRKDLQETSKAR